MAETDTLTPDMKPFAQANGPSSVLSLTSTPYSFKLEAHTLAQISYGWDPSCLPFSVLRRMGRHPAIYLAERTISGIIRRPDLYTVQHDDPKVVAFVYKWLRKILPRLTTSAARGFAYGSVPVLFNWERADVAVMVPVKLKAPKALKDGAPAPAAKPPEAALRKKSLGPMTYYSRSFEVSPEKVSSVKRDEDGCLGSLVHEGRTYGRDRIHLWSWDAEFEELTGQGARLRAWADYLDSLIMRALRNKYFERSVDSPRVGFVEPGSTSIGGVPRDNVDVMIDILMGLRGSGAAALPSKFDKEGNPLFDVKTLDLPDRAAAWDQILNRCDANIMMSYLVHAGLSGVEDLGATSAKTALEGGLKEHIEDLAQWVADGLTEIVAKVHRVNFGADVDPPEVVITDVGKATARKIYQAVLQLVAQGQGGEISVRTDVPKLLDKLGIPLRDAPPELAQPGGSESQGGAPGRARDLLGEREKRREDAITDAGEDAVGAPDEGEQ